MKRWDEDVAAQIRAEIPVEIEELVDGWVWGDTLAIVDGTNSAKVLSVGANLRQGPVSKRDNIIGVLARNSVVEVLDKFSYPDFIKIRVRTGDLVIRKTDVPEFGDGYVLGVLVTGNDEVDYYLKESALVFSADGVKDPEVIGRLPKGEVVNVLDFDDNFCHISYHLQKLDQDIALLTLDEVKPKSEAEHDDAISGWVSFVHVPAKGDTIRVPNDYWMRVYDDENNLDGVANPGTMIQIVERNGPPDRCAVLVPVAGWEPIPANAYAAYYDEARDASGMVICSGWSEIKNNLDEIIGWVASGTKLWVINASKRHVAFSPEELYKREKWEMKEVMGKPCVIPRRDS
jgi:hypothetical protein